MKSQINDIVFRNRYTLLVTVLLCYMLAITLEGLISGRESELLEFDNAYFTLDVRELRELSELMEDD